MQLNTEKISVFFSLENDNSDKTIVAIMLHLFYT